MNIFILLLAISVVGLTICFCLYMALGKIKNLEKRNHDLIDEKAKLSDQVRIKGIAVDRLTRELKKYSNVEIKVELTSREKGMILNALEMPHYQSLVQNPKTKFFIREIYRNLKEKIRESIKE